MRIVHSDSIIQHIKEMCIEANISLSEDMKSSIKAAALLEESQTGRKILEQLVDNMQIAEAEGIPICQDTGMAVVFLKIGQDVHIDGISIEAAVNQGIRMGYQEGFLRNSVVSDPLLRKNTNDNTPGVIYYEIVPGNTIEITIAPKGFGSENTSRVVMLKPSDGEAGVLRTVLQIVKEAGANACPPMVIGIGIGGTFDKCALLAKKALLRTMGFPSPLPHIQVLEEKLLQMINETNIGPAGFGGRCTALAVHIETYPTHIAGLPLAVNICCHVNRHVSRVL